MAAEAVLQNFTAEQNNMYYVCAAKNICFVRCLH